MKPPKSIRFGYYTATVFRANGTTRTYRLTNASRNRLSKFFTHDHRDGSQSVTRLSKKWCSDNSFSINREETTL